ncbi:MAG: type II toxin-antitoxin system VapC family toxin [Thiotrichales bacterium]|nr:type II toxin-antitoxin system VapC family toxin [Thiotrichales bacterium]
MKSSVYIETTIPSFYHEVRTELDMVARRAWTREWWDDHRKGYELFTSDAVIDELERGNFPNKDDALSLIGELPMLDIDQPVIETVSAYISHQLMPANPTGDALHLAIASTHKIDFLLTWNCRHLANANKFAHIRRVNGILGLFVPSLITPLELIGEMESP